MVVLVARAPRTEKNIPCLVVPVTQMAVSRAMSLPLKRRMRLATVRRATSLLPILHHATVIIRRARVRDALNALTGSGLGVASASCTSDREWIGCRKRLMHTTLWRLPADRYKVRLAPRIQQVE